MALLALFGGNAFAQQRVTGVVLGSDDGEPLVGATVRVDGHNLAAATDVDGRFVLNNVPKGAKTVTATYIGYTAKTVKIAPQLEIRLETVAETMDEVIVVAFGKQKRESFTGSAAVVGSKEIEKMTLNNPIEALNGTVTGLNMTETNSLTGDPTMTIRGIGSINAGTEPLIVLDGLPYSGYYNDINPNDVASITVLKDAASNALYGARGANGVILITTKGAKRGKTQVNFDAKWGVNTDGKIKYDYITDPGQYYEAAYLGYKNYYVSSMGMNPYEAHMAANGMLSSQDTGGLAYMVYDVPKGQTVIGSNGRLNPNATLGNRVAFGDKIYLLLPDNWKRAGLRNGFRQEYNVNLTGGNDQFTFLGTISYLSNEGLCYNNDIERFNTRFKAEYQAYNWLRIGGNAKYSRYTSNVSGNSYGSISVAPIYPLFVRDGNGNILNDSHGRQYDYGVGENAGIMRPIQSNDNMVQDDLINYNNNASNAVQFQGFATVNFPAGFQLTVNGSTYLTENRMMTAAPRWYGFNTNIGGYTDVSHYRTQDFNYQQLLQWNRQFGVNNFDVLLGHEYSNWLQTYIGGSKNVVAAYETNKELDGAVVDGYVGSNDSHYNVEGYFIRAQYDYDNKYFASGSFRRDGSSRFAKGHRYGNFWSLGGAWIITKEEWMPKNSWLNMLKLKVSYGEQGNDAIGNYRYIDTYTIANADGEVAYTFKAKGNENITWETVGSFNTGVEFELFNSRLNGGLEFYIRNTRDMLMWFSTPLSLGYSGYYDNIGDMKNTGVELTLNGDIIRTKNVSWSVGLNLTWERNRVTYLPEEKKGSTLNGYKGYTNGYYFIGEDLPVYAWRLKRYAGVNDEGKSLFYVQNADGTLGTTTQIDKATYMYCGTPLPDVFGGFNTTFRAYGFDLTAQFNYSVGGLKIDSGYKSLMSAPIGAAVGGAIHKDVFNCWSIDNPDSDIPAYTYNDQGSGEYTDRWLTNASFISLRSVNIGYTFPKKLISKLKMNSLRLYASADNIWYWCHRKGFDPRTGEKVGASLGTAYPMRTFCGGLQVQF